MGEVLIYRLPKDQRLTQGESFMVCVITEVQERVYLPSDLDLTEASERMGCGIWSSSTEDSPFLPRLYELFEYGEERCPHVSMLNLL